MEKSDLKPLMYGGKEITIMDMSKSRHFSNGHSMLVWNSDNVVREAIVYAIIPPDAGSDYPVITPDARYMYCAEIPETPLATNEELSWWICEGNRQVIDMRFNTISSAFAYNVNCSKNEVGSFYRVRRKGETDWHRPTKVYIEQDKKVGT